MVFISNGILFYVLEQQNYEICSQMDRTRKYNTVVMEAQKDRCGVVSNMWILAAKSKTCVLK